MKALLVTLSFIIASSAFAGDNPASEASIRKVLELTESRKVFDQAISQMDDRMQESFRQVVGNSPKQQAIIDRMNRDIVALTQKELSWEKMEPQVVTIYAAAFNEDEIAAMIAFYQSEAGRSIIRKMPQVLEENAAITQKFMLDLMPKIMEIQKEAWRQLDELSDEKE